MRSPTQSNLDAPAMVYFCVRPYKYALNYILCWVRPNLAEMIIGSECSTRVHTYPFTTHICGLYVCSNT